ncbi:MAG: methyltransferase [Candidatus Sabulitectum sp.]|nr:methyltransferase [Candidatus Sabulitectum sp.]
MGYLGGGKGVLPLSPDTFAGREITTDTLLIAEMAGTVPCRVCFDLGTGTGEILRNTDFLNKGVFTVGIDISHDALRLFDRTAGQPVLCGVNAISSVFRKACADLVLANPPYNIAGEGRASIDPLRQEARTGNPLLLYRFIFAAAYLLRSGGHFIISGRKERAEEIRTGLYAAGFSQIERSERGRVLAVKALMERSWPSEYCRSIIC